MPPTAVAWGFDSWQLPYNPCWQKTHFPQAMLNGTRTWSPTFSFSTPSPTSSTMPVNSWPNVIPTLVSGTDPLYRCKSEPQMHERVTLTMASSGCWISGTGFLSIRTLCGTLKFIASMCMPPLFSPPLPLSSTYARPPGFLRGALRAARPGLAVPRQERACVGLREAVERGERPLAVGGGGPRPGPWFPEGGVGVVRDERVPRYDSVPVRQVQRYVAQCVARRKEDDGRARDV